MKRFKTVLSLILAGIFFLMVTSIGYAAGTNGPIDQTVVQNNADDSSFSVDNESLEEKETFAKQYIDMIYERYGLQFGMPDEEMLNAYTSLELRNIIDAEVEDWLNQLKAYEDIRTRVIAGEFDGATADEVEEAISRSNGSITTNADNNSNIRMSIRYTKTFNPTKFSSIDWCSAWGQNGYTFKSYVYPDISFSNSNMTCLVTKYGEYYGPGQLVKWRYPAYVVLLA